MNVRRLATVLFTVLIVAFAGLQADYAQADYVPVDLAKLGAYKGRLIGPGANIDSNTFPFKEGEVVKCAGGDATFLFGPWNKADVSNVLTLRVDEAPPKTIELGEFSGRYSAVHMAVFSRGGDFGAGVDTFGSMEFVYDNGSKDSVALTKDGTIPDWCAAPVKHKVVEVKGFCGSITIDHHVYPSNKSKMMTKLNLPARDANWPAVVVLAITLEGTQGAAAVSPSGNITTTWGGIKSRD
jgi:hypothetical protein